MIRRLYLFARGVLVVSFRGKDLARFLNLCVRSGISFWDMECTDEGALRVHMLQTDVYALKPFLRKTHVRLAIEQRRGLPFLLHRYRARKVYALVFLAMLAGVAMLSTRIWRIEIIGNSSIGEETILAYLNGKDIHCGVKKALIDNDALELSMRQDFEPVIWASVYEEGTKLVVCLQEKLAAEQGSSDQEVCTDLVAARDATIVSIITRQGTPLVAAGDSVKAGDVLVCGRQEILDDNGEVSEYYYRSADADVLASVVYDYEDRIPVTVSEKEPTGRVKHAYELIVGSRQLRFPSLFADYDEYERLESVRQLVLMDSFYLPVYLNVQTDREQVTVERTRSEEEIKALALANLEQFLSDLEENGVSISDKNVMIEKADSSYHIYGKISAQESIAATAVTEVLQQPSESGKEEQQE